MFLGGINFSQFLSDYKEWHAFVFGLFGVLCPIPSKLTMSDKLKQETAGEYHYLMFGRGLGVLCWVLLFKAIQVTFW